MYGSILNRKEAAFDQENGLFVEELKLETKYPKFRGLIIGVLIIGAVLLYSNARGKVVVTQNDSSLFQTYVLDLPESGFNLLFDLTIDPNEKINMYYNSEYRANLSSALERVTSWMDKIGEVDSPDTTIKTSTWKAAGGVVPWLTDEFSRATSQLYSHSKAPNIVLFVVDDWGWNDVGYQSTYLDWTTPNIDKLASKGIKLTNYFTHELCVPSRAALMTGRYALRFGMNGAEGDSEELYLSEVTMAEELKSAGYRTNLVGKWHLGMSSLARTPTHRGFDHFFGYLGGYVDYWTKKYGSHQDLTLGTDLVSDESLLDPTVHSEYLYSAEAVRVIQDHAENYSSQPMFLYFASQLLHTVWEAPDTFIAQCSAVNSDATSEQQTYCAMNLMLDEVVGNITCALEASGMAENTLFILVSDNGGTAAMSGNNYPYKGGKGSLFRGAESVPGFIYGSDSLIPVHRRGGVYAGQMHVTDWLPTLMGLATGGLWSGSLVGNEIDGSDMWSAVLSDGVTAHPEIVHYLDSGGNVSYQHNMIKMVRYNSTDQTTTLPQAVFVGTAADTTVCLYAGEGDEDTSVIIRFLHALSSRVLSSLQAVRRKSFQFVGLDETVSVSAPVYEVKGNDGEVRDNGDDWILKVDCRVVFGLVVCSKGA
jgi:arylsulfatase B/arylsulfatase I/J